jgi:hypothetical protein
MLESEKGQKYLKLDITFLKVYEARFNFVWKGKPKA